MPNRLALRWVASPNLTADLVQVHKQVMAISTEPLFGAFRFRTEAADGEPEVLGMVRDRKMHRLVGDKISKDSLRRHDEAPVKRQVLQSRTVSPLRALTHDQDLIRLALQPGGHRIEV